MKGVRCTTLGWWCSAPLGLLWLAGATTIILVFARTWAIAIALIVALGVAPAVAFGFAGAEIGAEIDRRVRRSRIRRGRCASCDESLAGLRADSCPHCGGATGQRRVLRECHRCGYSLSGLASGACPECGASVAAFEGAP